MKFFLLLLLASSVFAAGQAERSSTAPEVNLYSHRHYDVDQKLYDQFFSETGIKVNVIKAGADELLERIKNEGPNSPADLLLTVDAGRLYKAQNLGLLQPIRSAILEESIPVHLRHPDGYWFGLTKRARVIAYSIDRVDPSSIFFYSLFQLMFYLLKN